MMENRSLVTLIFHPDGDDCDVYRLLLTDSQIRLLQWMKEHELIVEEASFYTVSDKAETI